MQILCVLEAKRPGAKDKQKHKVELTEKGICVRLVEEPNKIYVNIHSVRKCG